MTRNQIIERIAVLYLSLQFCTEKIRMFTVGERICINQERFQWLHILSEPAAEPRPVSAVLEAKIEATIRLVGEYHFEPSIENPFCSETETKTSTAKT